MIAKEQKEAVILETGVIQEESLKMDLDENSKQLLMQMLSKNLYSDAIGSTIRETASNALDSHRRIGVKEPIIVSLKKDENGNWEYSVEDFGTGLDSDDVKNTISKYGKSTKRMTANELGMFGLGFKSPLAYSSSFYFICRKDGIERKYMMYEGEDLNSIDLLYEIETNDKNGVKVIVPVKTGDINTFVNKIQQQLAYFEDVWFDVHGIWGIAIANDFKIIREEGWQFSGLSQDGYIHLCLDNVYYSLDYKAIGLDNPIRFPVALRFDLESGLYPIPNRESIKITEDVKKIILERLRNVVSYMVDKYNSTNESLKNFDEVRQYYDSDSRWLTINDHVFDISELQKFDKSIKLSEPSMDGIEKLNLKHLAKNPSNLFNQYYITHSVINGSIRKAAGHNINMDHFKKEYTIFLYETSIPSLFKEYVRDKYDRRVVFIRKKKDMPLKSRSFGGDSYEDACALRKHPKEDWRQIISEFQKIREYYTSQFIEATVENIPKEWKDEREARLKAIREEKRKKRALIKKEKSYGDICIKLAVSSQRRIEDKQCKFEANKLVIDDLPKAHGLVIYDLYENEDRLNYMYEFLNCGIRTIFSVSPREAKKLQKLDFHNLLTYEEFMKGETKPFARIVTADLISDLIYDNNYIFYEYGRNVIKRVSESLYKNIMNLTEYQSDYASRANGPAKEAMREIARENNIYDESIYPLYLEMKELFDSLKINKLFKGCNYSSGDYDNTLVSLLVDAFKYRKVKVNLEYYSNSNTPVQKIEEIEQGDEEELIDNQLIEEEILQEVEEEIEDDFPFN